MNLRFAALLAAVVVIVALAGSAARRHAETAAGFAQGGEPVTAVAYAGPMY
jgi:hypothetical protein